MQSAASQYCINSTSGWKTSREMMSYTVSRVVHRSLICAGSELSVEIDYSIISHKYSIGLVLGNVVVILFVKSFQNAPQINFGQLSPDVKMHYSAAVHTL